MAVVNSSRFNFSEIIQGYLYDFRDGVAEAVYESIDEVSKESVKRLKKDAPKVTGKYAKGWTRKLDKGRTTVGATIYGKKPETYAVAHLLEHGHAKRGGGRVASVPHIAEVEKWAIVETEDRILTKLERGII